MKKLLNTLYITLEDSYLSLDGENVVVIDGDREIGRVPLHNLEGIVSFGYRGTSPALMGACAEKNISLYAAGLISLMLNSPTMYADISSVMMLSVSVKVKASTTYCSVIALGIPSSFILS